MVRDYKSKETVLVITVALLVLFIWSGKKIFINLSLLAGLIGIFSFYLSRKIDWFWTHLSNVLGNAVTFILLTLIFFIVLSPVALIRKLMGKKTLLSPGKGDSYFHDRDQTYGKEDFLKTW